MSETDQLREALVAVMSATGMNEIGPTPHLGKCERCYSNTIAPTVKVCRRCAEKIAREALREHEVA